MVSILKHPIKTKLYWKLARWGDKYSLLRVPFDWIRYEILWNEDLEGWQ